MSALDFGVGYEITVPEDLVICSSQLRQLVVGVSEIVAVGLDDAPLLCSIFGCLIGRASCRHIYSCVRDQSNVI
jgi:hypothetical protein